MRVFRILALVFAVVLAFIIFAANTGLAPGIFEFFYELPLGDKIAHFLLMGTLSMLINLGFGSGRIKVSSLHLLRASVLLAALVTLEEASQVFIANRNFSLYDLSANYAGIFLLGELGAALRRTFDDHS